MTEFKTVFHVSDEEKVSSALGGIQNLIEDKKLPNKEIALVANGRAVKKFILDADFLEDVMMKVNQNVSIYVCSNSLEAFKINKNQLVKGVSIVPSGVGELTRLQNKGYAYIRI
jgi:uncharacterized protein